MKKQVNQVPSGQMTRRAPPGPTLQQIVTRVLNQSQSSGRSPRANAAKARPRRRSDGNQSSTIPRGPRRNQDQIGAVVRTRLTRNGIGDIRSLRIAAVVGYTFVGNGTNGTANSVYFQTASSTWLIQGQGAASSGQAPIAIADRDIGETYVSDVEKHFTRKVIKRMWIHVDSLQPSTSNNMMAVIGVSRGPNGMAFSVPIALATAAVAANTVNQVSSMRDSFPVDSWEHASREITQFIAGGSGARQNEFEIQSAPASNAQIYTTTATVPTIDGDSLIPACLAVAGNCTTAALQNTKVHQITIEQEVDLLDFVGGMSQIVATE